MKKHNTLLIFFLSLLLSTPLMAEKLDRSQFYQKFENIFQKGVKDSLGEGKRERLKITRFRFKHSNKSVEDYSKIRYKTSGTSKVIFKLQWKNVDQSMVTCHMAFEKGTKVVKEFKEICERDIFGDVYCNFKYVDVPYSTVNYAKLCDRPQDASKINVSAKKHTLSSSRVKHISIKIKE